MGCVLEFICELIFEGLFELMQFIVPDKMKNRKLRIALKVVVSILSFLLFVSMMLGIVMVIDDDPFEREIGKYFLFIPLGIAAVFILLGLIFRMIYKDKE